MKKYILYLSCVVILLAGCQTEATQPAFDQTAFLPTDATDVKLYDVDFDGDTEMEKVLVYKSNNTAQHVQVIAYNTIDEVWEEALADEFINDGQPARYLRDTIYLDLNQDDKQELIVRWSEDDPDGISQYYLIAYYQGEYKFVTPPAINPQDYLIAADGETDIHLVELEALDNGFRETYYIYCGDVTADPCNVIQLDLDYEYAELTRSEVEKDTPGQETVVGEFTYFLNAAHLPYGKTATGKVCFYPAQLETINNGGLFCFNNREEALAQFEIDKNTDQDCDSLIGVAEIVISDLSTDVGSIYKSDTCFTENNCAFNTATLVKTVEIIDAPACQKNITPSI